MACPLATTRNITAIQSPAAILPIAPRSHRCRRNAIAIRLIAWFLAIGNMSRHSSFSCSKGRCTIIAQIIVSAPFEFGGLRRLGQRVRSARQRLRHYLQRQPSLPGADRMSSIVLNLLYCVRPDQLPGCRFGHLAMGRPMQNILHDRRSLIDSGTPQGCQGDVEFIYESHGIIFQSNITLKLLGKAIDEACPKTAPRRPLDRRTARFGP